MNYLLEVATTHSIEQAAKNLGVTQSIINYGIKDLEKKFNLKLLYRKHEGIELTEEGKVFLIHAQSILRKIDYMKEKYARGYVNHAFNLTISSDTALCLTRQISKLYQGINAKKINISLKETDRDKVIEAVLKAESEVGVITFNSIEEKIWKSTFEANKLDFYEMTREKGYCLVGKNHPLYKNNQVTLEELKDFTRLQLLKSTKFFDETDEYKILRFSDRHTMHAMITEGIFYMLTIGQVDEQSQEMLSIPLSISNNHFQIGWIKQKESILSEEAKQLIDLLEQD